MLHSKYASLLSTRHSGHWKVALYMAWHVAAQQVVVAGRWDIPEPTGIYRKIIRNNWVVLQHAILHCDRILGI